MRVAWGIGATAIWMSPEKEVTQAQASSQETSVTHARMRCVTLASGEDAWASHSLVPEHRKVLTQEEDPV